MGSGGSAVDAMVIGCLGVERRAERFLSYLAIFSLCTKQRFGKRFRTKMQSGRQADLRYTTKHTNTARPRQAGGWGKALGRERKQAGRCKDQGESSVHALCE